MKIGILSTSQHDSLRVAMSALRPDAQVVSFDIGAAWRDEAARPQVAAILAGCDEVLTVPAPSHYGPLGTGALRAAARLAASSRVHIVPALRFSGFHPDVVNIRLDQELIGGPTGHSHSRIAIAGYLAGLSPRVTADLYHRPVFARLGYLDGFAAERARLFERFAMYGMPLEDAFERWMARGCFMYDVGHPRLRVILDVARAACRLMGLAPAENAPDDSALPDPLASLAIHPVFPDIAAAIGVAPAGAFRPALRIGVSSRVMSTEAFVTASHAAFARVPLSVLRRADGVMAAIEALDLREARRPTPPVRESTDRTTAFLTWHGTVLGIETASAMMMQRPFAPDDGDSTDMLAELPGLPVTERLQANLMGGVAMSPLPGGGVSFEREGMFLCAVPWQMALRFDRVAVSLWESFLPVSARDLAALRALAEGHWRVEGGAAILPGAVMRLLPEFKFAVGELVLDLLQPAQFPVAEALDDGATGYRVRAGGRDLLLVPAAIDARRNEILLREAPAALGPVEVGTPEEFRLSRRARLRLQGPVEFLHTPLTVCDADRDWMFARYFDRAGELRLPGVGRHWFEAILVRGADNLLMLGQGVEGVLAGADGVAKGFDHLRQTARFLDLDAARDAPSIDGPVCVFYNPGLRRYRAWLTEAVLGLHIMQPHLPAGTRLVLPSGETASDRMDFLNLLGFGKLATIGVAGGYAGLRDAIWLQAGSMNSMPAVALQSFRARAVAMRKPEGKRRRLYIKRAGSRQVGNSAVIEAALRGRGFEIVSLEEMPAAARIDLFLHAEFVIGVHGSALANIVFCPAGAKVLELSPEAEFRTFYWLMAEKLGLSYAVLPCATEDGRFDSELTVDEDRFRALFRMLRAVDTAD